MYLRPFSGLAPKRILRTSVEAAEPKVILHKSCSKLYILVLCTLYTFGLAELKIKKMMTKIYMFTSFMKPSKQAQLSGSVS